MSEDDRAANEALKARIASLEAALARADQRIDAFTSTLPGISWETWGHPYETPVSYISASAQTITGYAIESWDNPGFWLSIIHEDDRERVAVEIEEILLRGDEISSQEYRWCHADGAVRWAHVRATITRDDGSDLIVWRAFTLDITAQKEAEVDRDKMREELIDAQSERIAELSTPLLPVADGVLVMPLVGQIDRSRADRVIDVLLRGICDWSARVAILDITGVPTADADVARALLGAAKASRLVGAQVIITGIRPHVASAIAAEEEGLQGIITCATLKQGIARALGRGSLFR